jgi:hypothetical protein
MSFHSPFIGVVMSSALIASACEATGTNGASAIRAPVDCKGTIALSCGTDNTLSGVENTYRRTKKLLQKMKLECEEKHSSCVGKAYSDLYGTGCYHYWAPANELEDGNTALATLLSRAQTGQPFDIGKTPTVIVESSKSTPLERHLATCEVVTVSNVAGPPHECETIAIITPSTAWLRASDTHLACDEMAAFGTRVTGAVDVFFHVATNIDPLLVSRAIITSLDSELGLSTTSSSNQGADGAIESIHIISTVGIRESPILKGGWRETLDFDLDLTVGVGGNIYVHGTLHSMVARQAVGDLTNLQGPNAVQQNMYAQQFDLRMSEAIKTVCKKRYDRHDSDHITCD